MIAAPRIPEEAEERMFPVGDDNTQRRITPVVTFALIGLNILVFFLELAGGDPFITEWAFIPERFSEHPAANVATVFSAMFMHGGWLHLFGNMLFLWIFGDNVEDRLGHLKFLIFYLLAGIAATLSQYAVAPESGVPNVGASGAIAGVLGAYILMFPQARVNVLLGRQIVAMPAFLVLGMWIVLQLVSGVGTIAYTDESADVGGIAYMAHIGGFGAGLLMAFLLRDSGSSGTTA
ncbi:MAG: rhomboid family intramembrane serine protease [Methyloceanibacter sp.]